jgi:hypothetical protein
MKATNKSLQVEAALDSWMGKSRVRTIANGECMTCDMIGITADSFRDELSIKEYTISGMCQKCQDSVFGGDDE